MTDQELLLRDYSDCQNAIRIAEVSLREFIWEEMRRDGLSVDAVIGVIEYGVKSATEAARSHFKTIPASMQAKMDRTAIGIPELKTDSFRRYVAARLGMM